MSSPAQVNFVFHSPIHAFTFWIANQRSLMMTTRKTNVLTGTSSYTYFFGVTPKVKRALQSLWFSWELPKWTGFRSLGSLQKTEDAEKGTKKNAPKRANRETFPCPCTTAMTGNDWMNVRHQNVNRWICEWKVKFSSVELTFTWTLLIFAVNFSISSYLIIPTWLDILTSAHDCRSRQVGRGWLPVFIRGRLKRKFQKHD